MCTSFSACLKMLSLCSERNVKSHFINQMSLSLTNTLSRKVFEFTLLVIFFFYQIFFPMSGMSRMISVGFAVLYCMYIIYDTGLIMERLTPEEYIIAPAILYMDMVALFLRLLKLRGERERRNDQIKDWFPTRSDYYTNEIYFE